MPATDFVLRVERAWKGQTRRQLVFRVPGGELPDGTRLTISSAPRLAIEQEVLLFLRQGDDGSLRLVQMELGAFHVRNLGGRDIAFRAVDLEADRLTGSRAPGGERWLGLRDAQRFGRWIRDLDRGARTAIDGYFADDVPNSRVEGFSLIEFGGSPARWNTFTPAFGIVGTLIGAGDGGTSAAKNGAGALNAASDLNIGVSSGGGANAVYYEDPSDEIDGSFSCADGGTLAFAAVYTNGSKFDVDGVTFSRITFADIVVQDGIDCFLASDSEAAEELLGHEFGHAVGIGHSGTGQALMYPFIHGDGRGASLHADDKDALAALRYTSGGDDDGGGGGGGGAPSTPTSLGAVVDGSTTTLSWSAGAGASADEYIVEVGTSPGSKNYAATTTTSTTVSFDSIPTGTYYARVKARNGSGTSAATADKAFVITGSAPATPKSFNTVVKGDTITFSWDDVTARDPATEYVVEIGSTRGARDVETLEVNRSPLELRNVFPDEYFARVLARNEFGDSSPTSDRRYVIAPQAPPGSVEQLRPRLFSSLAATDLQWVRTAGAVDYEVTVEHEGVEIFRRSYSDDDHCIRGGNCFVAANNISPGPLRDGTYEWFIRGSNKLGEGKWESSTFRVKRAALPRKPALRGPANNAKVGSRPEFRWRSEERANVFLLVVTNSAARKTFEYRLTAVEVCAGAKTCSFTPPSSLPQEPGAGPSRRDALTRISTRYRASGSSGSSSFAV